MNNFFEAIPANILESIGSMELNIESENCHKAVDELLAKTVLSGGKRLRPMLTYLMGNLFGLGTNDLKHFAKAIEMVHAASLAHDDVVDNATQRRGEPSINIEASNKKAVLAGDYLLADVIYNLAHNGDLTIVKKMSTVIQELALGEWIQSDAIEKRDYSFELIEQIAQYKTASVMSWCTWVSSYVVQSPEHIQNQANEFGRRVGLAFQMMDDALDFAKTSKKDFLLDVKNGVVNSVILEWLHRNEEAFSAYKAGASLESVFTGVDILDCAKEVKSKAQTHMGVANKCLFEISEYLKSTGLSELEIDQKLAPLEFIISYIIDRDL